MFAFLGNIGVTELLVIFLIVLLFFGGKKIPEIARGLGKGLREFKKAKDGLEESLTAEEPRREGGKPGAASGHEVPPEYAAHAGPATGEGEEAPPAAEKKG
ncbi:MAG: twin-arginine translocase TatA/TatE family subunit [Lentisphaeria bacterium]|jgi:sec-independent protein translocase protein TatA